MATSSILLKFVVLNALDGDSGIQSKSDHLLVTDIVWS